MGKYTVQLLGLQFTTWCVPGHEFTYYGKDYRVERVTVDCEASNDRAATLKYFDADNNDITSVVEVWFTANEGKEIDG